MILMWNNVKGLFCSFLKSEEMKPRSIILAETFLKIKTTESKMAHIAISGILKNSVKRIEVEVMVYQKDGKRRLYNGR